jgi:inhibitor of cysteine peptidase
VLPVGKTLRVELETIPTAGYVWQVTGQPDMLALTDEATRPTDPEVQNQPGFTGGNHYMAFDFTAIAPGTGALELTEGRPWELEAGEPPEGTFSLTITVTD